MTTTNGATATSAGGIARRGLERFALIAFALYHLPLFLNNYPSLGGGGFNDTGLAPRWGHVFAPAGVWVARTVFHMTGPMPLAYSGDNGDVGEEWGRLLLCIAAGAAGAIAWTLADRKRPGGGWVGGALRLLLRFSIALGLASYAMAKLYPQQFPPLTVMGLEDRVGDLTPMRLLWTFMQASRPYNFFAGVMEMAAVLLLCWRRTATLGALICITVMSNVALLNYLYGVQVKLYSTMIVLSAAVLALYDAPRLLAFFVRNADAAPASLGFPPADRLSAPVRWTIKAVLVGSVILSSYVVMSPADARAAAPSPLDGAWQVSAFSRDGQALESTGNPARWRRLIVANGGVAIRFETDSITRCRRSPSADAGRLSFACARNRQGDLQWTRTGDTLRVDGTFDGAKVSATARHLEPADYPLLRSKFRLIYDR